MIKPETKIQDCDLSIHIKKILFKANIITISNLMENKLFELMKFRGLGEKSIKEIFSFTHENGLFFK